MNQYNDPRVDSLFQLADQSNPLEVRMDAAHGLARLASRGSKEATRALFKLANDSNPIELRRFAAGSIANDDDSGVDIRFRS